MSHVEPELIDELPKAIQSAFYRHVEKFMGELRAIANQHVRNLDSAAEEVDMVAQVEIDMVMPDDPCDSSVGYLEGTVKVGMTRLN